MKTNISLNALWRAILISAIFIALFSSPVRACTIPVFRYALWNWPADRYAVIVFHRGSLSLEEQAAVNKLRNASSYGDFSANVMVKIVDLSKSSDEAMLGIWQAQSDTELPWMVVGFPWFPRISDGGWSGRLTAEAVEALLDSPLRKEIAGRIFNGEVAVWVFLESGDRQQDESAANLLEAMLKKMSEELNIQVLEGFGDQVDTADTSVKFSMVRLSRKNSSERMFTEMLLQSEWDLKTLPKPMAFPVFGRGRVLYALVGEWINEDNIEMTCSFLVGWCSCQVKELNPGADLLMSVNWDDMIDEQLLGYEAQEYEEMPALISSSESPGANAFGANALDKGNPSTPKRAIMFVLSTALIRNTMIVVLILVLSVAIVTCVVLRRKRQRV